ncbi:TRAP transporter substrate-binding protein DctP [Marivibrio halodurans]|uniref:TRAP transporter substrate-binding protein DctP n=1 Tax=Marivibrio halodurans TaxID=2039722 RepID=A0A8J7S0N1_9PROT|nr:TRAP transporter substrate-binding protein DctP [Marivibrio halodurans]MBP5856529.1 TRAP transporter substrate-binding protein DctP [Marivibrio halodurans]
MSIFGRYGMASTMLAASGMAGAITAPRLAAAAEETQKDRYTSEPKYKLRYGGAGYNAERLKYVHVGCLDFIRDLEERTNGAIRVEFIGENQICNELDCVKKTQQGIIDIFTSSTQNAAGAAPYYNALDFAYMFPSRSSFYHFLYHPKSETLLREPLRRLHKVQFLFTMYEARGLMMGLKYKDRPTISTLEELQGGKNRVTGSQPGRIAMDLMGLNPVPVAWEETLDGLKQGLIDGAETWMSAVAAFNMTPVVSQAVDLRFFCGAEHAAMNLDVFEKLEPEYQDAIMESAYLTQARIQGTHEAALVNFIGATNPPMAGTVFDEYGVRVAQLPDEEIAKAEQLCAPEHVPEPWEQWRERINEWSGGHDVYSEIHAIAREIPKETPAQDVTPRRWWNA